MPTTSERRAKTSSANRTPLLLYLVARSMLTRLRREMTSKHTMTAAGTEHWYGLHIGHSIAEIDVRQYMFSDKSMCWIYGKHRPYQSGKMIIARRHNA
jgi:hypothetical protein